MPEKETSGIFKLLKFLKLSSASPEFLVDAIGNYWLIDLNPCGDWYGFGPASDSLEIAREITSKL